MNTQTKPYAIVGIKIRLIFTKKRYMFSLNEAHLSHLVWLINLSNVTLDLLSNEFVHRAVLKFAAVLY